MIIGAPVLSTLLGARVEWWTRLRREGDMQAPEASFWCPDMAVRVQRGIDEWNKHYEEKAKATDPNDPRWWNGPGYPNDVRCEGEVISVLPDRVHVRDDAGYLWSLRLDQIGLLLPG